MEIREKTLKESRKRRELEEREKGNREEEEKAETVAKEKRAIEEMREVMTRMRKNIEAPAKMDTMAAAETDTMAAAEKEIDDGGSRNGTRNEGDRGKEGAELEGRCLVEARMGETIGVLERSDMEQTAGDSEPHVVRDQRTSGS